MSRVQSEQTRRWEHAAASADLVVVGPTPPLRGGVAAHTARLVEHCVSRGLEATAASYRRLYPAAGFPGRCQRGAQALPPWSEEILDVLDPRTWIRLGDILCSSRATVVLQWWHPVVAPALLMATRRVDRGRVVALCHNALPHEAFPASRMLARRVFGRCGRVVCHSRGQAEAVGGLLGPAASIRTVPLPGLLAPSGREAGPVEQAGQFERRASSPDPPAVRDLRQALPGDARVLVAAGHMRAYKGLEVLVQAWKLARRPAEARLLLVGECYLRGASRRRLQEALEGEGSIVFLDRYVEDSEFVGFLDLSEAVVAAHLRASQSGVLPLARAMGLPCIVSDAGGLAEQLDTAGPADPAKAGPDRVVPAGDPRRLAAALEEHFARPARRGRAGRPGTGPERKGAFVEDWRRVIEAIGVSGRR